MMKKSILSFVLVLMWGASAMSKNVSDMFIDMPDTVMPYISREQRIDLVNMRRIDTQTPATVKSVFRSDVSLTELADDRLTIEDGSFQYALIRLSGNGADSLFCELCTVQPVYSTTSCHIYDGNWNDDVREGKGTYYYKNGNRYDGDWKNDKREGKGIMYYINGDKKMGDYLNGEPIGTHTIVYNNGEISSINY